MNSFTIKDLENLSGIKAHTLRIWEQRYDFLKPNRTFSNIRYYSNEELKKVLNISLLNKYGFKISHINRMNEIEREEKILALDQGDAPKERVVYELIQSMVDMDMVAFEKTLNRFIKNKGIEITILQIIFPYLEKIGILWTTNHINPAQEHLVTNIIRQKLIAGIDALIAPEKPRKKILLFLPEGEHHELGLLFMHYLLKRNGTAVIYLGADIPMSDIVMVADLKKPDYLYCHLTTAGQNFNFDKFLLQLKKNFHQLPVIISGQFTQLYEKKIKPPLYFKKSLSEVKTFISTL